MDRSLKRAKVFYPWIVCIVFLFTLSCNGSDNWGPDGQQNPITLNFINRSNVEDDVSVVVFQENMAVDVDAPVVAWNVMENFAPLENQILAYPVVFEVDVEITGETFTNRVTAEAGQRFVVEKDAGENELVYEGQASFRSWTEVVNALMGEVIQRVNLYKGGKVLMAINNVAPGQVAAFRIPSIMYVAVVSDVVEGQLMDSSVMESTGTAEIDLFNIIRADIVLTGGGSEPYEFNLKNVQYAS